MQHHRDNITREEEQIDFSYILGQLYDNKWLIVLVTVTFLVAGTGYSLVRKPLYQASMLVQVEENRSTAKSIGQMADVFMTGGTNNNIAEIQKALIKSRFVLAPVIDSLNLDLDIRPQQSWLSRIRGISPSTMQVKKFIVPASLIHDTFTIEYNTQNHIALYDAHDKKILEGSINTLLSTPEKTIQLQVTHINAPLHSRFSIMKYPTSEMLRTLSKNLKIEDLGGKQNIGILEITYQDYKPERATAILQEIAAITQHEDAKKKSLEASQTLNFLYQQLPIAKATLESAEKKLNQYRAKSGKIDMTMQAKALLERLASLDEQLTRLQIKKVDMSLQFTEHHPAFIALNRWCTISSVN